MAIPLVVNGVTFNYPQQFDTNWGPTLTNWSSAVTSGMLQKAGGSFTLTAEVDFGASFGLKVLSIKSKESNTAATGFVRLANASAGLVWRNAANSADLALTVNASNQLTFNGTSIGATTSLTNGHILVGNVSNQPADVAMSGDTTITNAGVVTIGAGTITNAKIISSAGISLNKLAALSASQIAVSDSSGFLASLSSPTLTELGYVAGVTSAIQTQINTISTAQGNYLPLAGGTMSGAINMASHKLTAVTQGTTTGDAVSFPITTTQISSTAGIVGTQLASATVTGTQIASSVALAGSPTTTTQTAGDSSTKIATTAYVQSGIKVDLLGSQVASTSAAIIFSGLAGASYAYYELIIDNLQSGTDAVSARAQISTGSGFLTANYTYETIAWAGTTSSVTSATGQASWDVMDGAGTGVGVIQSLKITVFGADSNTTGRRIVYESTGFYQSGLFFTTKGGGVITGANGAAIDGIQVFMSTGNIATGRFRLYGYRNS